MKTISYILGFAALILLAGCEKETEGISFETNYAVFEMTGDNPLIVTVGNFAEPGVKATAGEEELEVQIETDLDKDEVGIYTINYSAVNPDGFSASTSRTVIVYDPNTPESSLPGTYTSSVVRTEADGTLPRSYNGFPVTITKYLPGIYYVSDLLGGVYDKGFSYGPDYAMTGYVTLNPDNSLRLLSSHIVGWGDGLAGFKTPSFDPNLGTATWTAVYASNDNFRVVIKRQE